MSDAQAGSLGKRLRQERELRHWTQEQLAEHIGRSVPSINRWEHDRAEPQPDALKQLTALFGKPPDRWGMSRWNVPFLRNPYFTGREQLLSSLHRTLSAEKTVALSQTRAISGLGGIGKTQIAIEYAYRYAREYEAVLWVQADSYELLGSDFARLAQTLDLPDKEEKDQWRIVSAVKRWLQEHSAWLLILDNADDLSVLADVLPRGVAGATLLTTRSQITGKIAKSLAVEKMEVAEGIRLVLRRAKLLSEDEPLETVSAATRTATQRLVEELDGLPLALDQAGAYIEETGCSLSEYLALYGRHRLALLKREGSMGSDYPHTVASTWALSFLRVEQASLAAADLLRLCAFLHPDAIPEAIVTEGATELGPVLSPVAADPLLLNGAIQVLRRYSLVKRDPEAKLLNIHRLVQVVLKESLDAAAQRKWAECSVRAVNRAFPGVESAFCERCELCLPHALLCAQWIEQYDFTFPEAARLLHVAGVYLRERTQYAQAEPLLKRSLSLRKQVLGSQHPDMANTLNALAYLYVLRGDYEDAEVLLQPALADFERVLGPEHPEVATAINNLASAYKYEGKYTEAEPLLQHSLAIRERALGESHPLVAESLNNLALLYSMQGKYAQAEPLYQRSFTLSEQTLGPEHSETLIMLGNLAHLYTLEGKYAQAEPLLQRALAAGERTLGSNHQETAVPLRDLGWLYTLQGKYAQAEPLLQRAQSILERLVGPMHRWTLETLRCLANLAQATGQDGRAQSLYQQVLASYEQTLGPEHPLVAKTLTSMGQLYTCQGHYTRAESLLQRALTIDERKLGPALPQTATALDAQGHLALLQGREEQAESLLQRALTIQEQALGNAHPDVARTLQHLAQLYEKQGKHEQAYSLYQQALAIREQALGAEHPDTTETMHDLALYWEARGNSEEACTWYTRALVICEQALGAQHLKTTQTRTRLIDLLHAMGQHEDAAHLEATQSEQRTH